MLSRFSKLSQAFAKRRSFSTIVEEPVKKSVPTMDFSNMGSGNLNTDPEMQHHIEQCRRIQAEKNIPVYETVIVDHELAQFNRLKDGGKFFSVDQTEIAEIMPEGLSKKMKYTLETTPKSHWMLRTKTKALMSRLQKWPRMAKEVPSALILDGESGTGKSVALAQIVQFCRAEGWLALYIPNARSWCFDAPYVEESKTHPGKYDVGDVVEQMLEKFLKVHEDKLGEIELMESYTGLFEPYLQTFKGKTMKDLVKFAIEFPETSCTVVDMLRTELNHVTKFPVLIAVDEYNWWHYNTVFGYEGRDVLPQEIVPVHSFSQFSKSDVREEKVLKNGIFIGATAEHYTTPFKFTKEVNCAKHRQTFQPYTPHELDCAMKYFLETGFTFDDVDDVAKTEMRFMTKNNPQAIFTRSCYM